MNHYYILSGYSIKGHTLRTKKVSGTIDDVLNIINFWQEQAQKPIFDDKEAFESAVQSSSKNGHAFSIDTNPIVLWNIYYV